ncbi:hypothetical protein B0I37DRAFT_394700 [Chaetomium sp. MPI-CAGE-AT-0009]|nr:hypothetical protein B0I37DRAFT_394700 [Chaetomium sp. MPI-CAGE-AT-0009]
MPQPLIHPQDNRAAYSYAIQPTEDHGEEAEWAGSNTRGRKSPVWRSGNTPNYKPTPLRWPFIGTVIALLLVAIMLVIVAERRMPNSDSDVQILGVHPNATQPVRFARAVFSNSSTPQVEVTTTGGPTPSSIVVSTTPSPAPTSSSTTNEQMRNVGTTSSTLSVISSQSVGSTVLNLQNVGTTFSTLPVTSSQSVGSTVINLQNVGTTSSTPKSTTRSTSTSTSLPSVSKFTTNITVPVTTVTYTSTFTSVSTIEFAPPPMTSVATFVSTVIDVEPTTMPVSTGTRTQTSLITLTSTVAVGGAIATITGVVIPSVGEVTITYYRTIFPPEEVVQVTQPPDRVKVTGVEVIGETTVDIVQTQGPVVMVVPPSDKVQTQVVGPHVSTGVARVGARVPAQVVTTVGGTPMTVVNNPDPVTVVREVDGVQRTIVETPPPQTVVRPITSTMVGNVGGTPVTLSYTVFRDGGGTLFTEAIVTTPTAAGQPLTLTAVDVVGGTPVTRVFVTTPAGPPFQPVSYTVVRDGGGTLFTEVIVATPTAAGQPLTLTAVDAVGGTPVTQVVVTSVNGVVARPVSFTITTNVGGTPTVITVTPTILSTRPGTTRTFTSTSTAKHTNSNPLPTTLIPTTTRIYRWTEADIFLGTFLPPLLGVALVIPLRIIDLNAKLYQPFQTLTHPPSSPASLLSTHPLLHQHTGFHAILTPLALLFRCGQPIPFLTTLAVACASLAAPLAAEAIGLKLHGACWANTASARCAPALGVSVAPAYALVGVLVVAVVLVAVVGAVVGRWVTGVRANPWCLAGVASLAGDGRGVMKRVVGARRYGLGWFSAGDGGREEYGIVVLDEAGEGFRPGPEVGAGESELELNEDLGMAGKWRGQQQLPFMTLRYPWRIAFILFQLAVLIFIIYYHAYYRGGIRDNGRLWLFFSSNRFGVRFVSAIIGVIIAFCWQSFFLSVSAMTPFHLLSKRTQPPSPSILFSPPTNPFSGLRSAVRHRQPFFFAVSLAAVLSEFLPVVLSNVPFNLAQTRTAATVCAVLSCVVLGLLLAVLGASFAVRYPPMPVDPRCVAGLLWYVARSGMLDDFARVSRLDGEERARRVGEMGKRYFYGVLVGDGEERRLGVDCDLRGGGEEDMGIRNKAVL